MDEEDQEDLKTDVYEETVNNLVKKIDESATKDVYDEFIQTLVKRMEKAMKIELEEIKGQFMDKAKKFEDERLKMLSEEYKGQIRKEIEQKDAELEYRQRIINIQAALLSRLIDENRDTVLRVLQNANLSEEDLQMLSGETAPVMRRER